MRIELVTGDLRDVKRPLRLAGQVIGENRDGTIRIHTVRGDVDLRLRGQEELPEGTSVEVDIPPGRPPRMAVIRAVPEDVATTPRGTGTTAQNIPSEIPPSTPVWERDRVQPPPLPAVMRGDAPPDTDDAVLAEYLPPVIYTPRSLPPEDFIPPEPYAAQRPLHSADIVRLLPLSPEQVAQVVRPLPDIIASVVTQTVDSVVLRAVLIAAVAVDNQLRPIVRADVQPLPVVPNVPLPVTAPSSNVSPEPVPAPSGFTVVPESAPVSAVKVETTVPAISITSLPELPVTAEPRAIPTLPAPPVSFLFPDVKPATSLVLSPVVQQSITMANASSFDTLMIPEKTQAAVTIAPVSAPRAVSFFPALLSAAPLTAAIPAPPLLHHQPVVLTLSVDPPTVSSLQNIITTASGFPAPAVSQNILPSTKPQVLDIGIVKILPSTIRIVPPNNPAIPNIPSASPQAFPVQNPFIAQTIQAAAPVPDVPAVPPPLQQKKSVFSPDIPVSLPVTMKSSVAPVPELQILVPPPFLTQEKPVASVASVIGHTPQNLPVLSIVSPGAAFPQEFALQFGASNLPAGTMVAFIPQPGGAPYQAAFPTAEIVAGAPILPTPIWPLLGSFDWPVLDEVQQLLQQQGAVQAFESLVRTAPNPGNPARMPAAALFFLAAVRSGDIAGWLGDKTMDALRRAGRTDIAIRGARDFAGLQRTSSEPISQDWRGMALPMAWQDDMHKAMLYFRRSGGDEDNEQGGGFGTRFIFDLDLPRMGVVQLDGLHRTKRLDLIVRSRSPFSDTMQQAMRRTWGGALEQAALSGELSFQSKPSQFVKIELPVDRRGIRV